MFSNKDFASWWLVEHTAIQFTMMDEDEISEITDSIKLHCTSHLLVH